MCDRETNRLLAQKNADLKIQIESKEENIELYKQTIEKMKKINEALTTALGLVIKESGTEKINMDIVTRTGEG